MNEIMPAGWVDWKLDKKLNSDQLGLVWVKQRLAKGKLLLFFFLEGGGVGEYRTNS